MPSHEGRQGTPVPSYGAARTLLDAMPRLGGIVFPGRKQGAELSDVGLTAVL
jgi:hypothetical protein